METIQDYSWILREPVRSGRSWTRPETTLIYQGNGVTVVRVDRVPGPHSNNSSYVPPFEPRTAVLFTDEVSDVITIDGKPISIRDGDFQSLKALLRRQEATLEGKTA